MKIKKGGGEPDNNGDWMTTYGDMVTLLLTFFVLLFSMSSIDNQKYIKLANSLRGALGGNVGVLNSGTTVDPQGDMSNQSQHMQNVMKQLQNVANDKGLQDKMEITINETGITISFKEKLFFNIGSADILKEAYPILQDVADILRDEKFPIRVEGHTCDLVIRTAKFPSNWELSATRAVNVSRFMVESCGVPGEKISVAAYGEFRPLVPNDSEENRVRNRRVDIVLVNTKITK